MALTVGSLFAGIGGFDLGLELAGMEVKWQVEIDPFARKVLEKHWPHVGRHEDVRMVHGARACVADHVNDYRDGCFYCLSDVDVLCGGFPCQDISYAGDGGGIDGERSGLWAQFDRLIGELRPRYVVVENVAALLGRGLGRVLGSLAARRYDAEWDCLPARAFGAPHQRDRVWVVAYTDRWGQQEREKFHGQSTAYPSVGHPRRQYADGLRHVVADASCDGLGGPVHPKYGSPQDGRIFSRRAFAGRGSQTGSQQWESEPDVGRVAHGVPARVDRLRGLGNAIVPQIAEWIGRRILEAEERLSA